MNPLGDLPSPDAGPPPPARAPLVRRRVLLGALAFAATCFLFFKFLLMPVKILGDSMAPTYRDGSLHFLNRMAYWSRDPRRGDVVGLRSPSGDIYIKRVVGLPGETLSFWNGKVLVNGQALDESYAPEPVPWHLKPIRLGTNDFFVMGDNRGVSVLGPLPREQILGKIVTF